MLKRIALLLLVAIAAVQMMANSSEGARLPGAKRCPVFPKSSHWNRPVDKLPLHSRSAQIVSSIGRDEHAHADFGSGLTTAARSAFRTARSRAAPSACR